MLFIVVIPLVAQKFSYKAPLEFGSGSPFLPIRPLQVSLSVPARVLKSPIRTIVFLDGTLYRSSRDSKKAGFSKLLSTIRALANHSHLEVTPLFSGGNSHTLCVARGLWVSSYLRGASHPGQHQKMRQSIPSTRDWFQNHCYAQLYI